MNLNWIINPYYSNVSNRVYFKKIKLHKSIQKVGHGSCETKRKVQSCGKLTAKIGRGLSPYNSPHKEMISEIDLNSNRKTKSKSRTWFLPFTQMWTHTNTTHKISTRTDSFKQLCTFFSQRQHSNISFSIQKRQCILGKFKGKFKIFETLTMRPLGNEERPQWEL